MSATFDQLLLAASILSGSSKTVTATKDVQNVLFERLIETKKVLGDNDVMPASANTAERDTALYGLTILEQVQRILDLDQGEHPS